MCNIIEWFIRYKHLQAVPSTIRVTARIPGSQRSILPSRNIGRYPQLKVHNFFIVYDTDVNECGAAYGESISWITFISKTKFHNWLVLPLWFIDIVCIVICSVVQDFKKNYILEYSTIPTCQSCALAFTFIPTILTFYYYSSSYYHPNIIIE